MLHRLIELAEAFATHVKLVGRKWPASVPAGLLTVLSIIDEGRTPTDQFVLPPLEWLLIAMGCVMVGQFLVWKDNWFAPAEDGHADLLRETTAKVKQGGLRILQHEQVIRDSFLAHFPEVEILLEDVDDAYQAVSDAEKTFDQAMQASGAERFQRSGGWEMDVTGKRFATFLQPANLLAADPPKLPLSISHDNKMVVLGGTVVWTGEGAEGHDEGVRQWIRDMFQSPEADAVREMHAARRQQTEGLVAALDLIALCPIKKAPGCKICFPPSH